MTLLASAVLSQVQSAALNEIATGRAAATADHIATWAAALDARLYPETIAATPNLAAGPITFTAADLSGFAPPWAVAVDPRAALAFHALEIDGLPHGVVIATISNVTPERLTLLRRALADRSSSSGAGAADDLPDAASVATDDLGLTLEANDIALWAHDFNGIDRDLVLRRPRAGAPDVTMAADLDLSGWSIANPDELSSVEIAAGAFGVTGALSAATLSSQRARAPEARATRIEAERITAPVMTVAFASALTTNVNRGAFEDAAVNGQLSADLLLEASDVSADELSLSGPIDVTGEMNALRLIGPLTVDRLEARDLFAPNSVLAGPLTVGGCQGC